MKPASDALEHASVQQYCKSLRVPVIAAFVPLAEQAVKENRNIKVSGSLTGDGERRARSARSAESTARCTVATPQRNAGGVRLQPSTADSGSEDSRAG